MEYFRYTLQFLNTITFTSSTYTELDNYLNGVVKGYLNHNFGFLPIAPTEDELDELAEEIGASYDLMLNDIKPRYEEVLRLGTVHTFRSKDTTDSVYGDEERTGKYYEPVVSSAQTSVKTNGELTTWEDDKVTLSREEDRVLSESAIKDFFKEIKEEVELYFIDFVNIYADGTGCQKPYTLEQLEAINSGATKEKIDQIRTNKENIDLLIDAVGLIGDALDDKQDKLNATQLDAVNSGIDATKVAQIDTNKNNIAQLSNPNLLINGDFRVNQRGSSSYTTIANYTVDRWYMATAGTTLTTITNGVTLAGTSSNNYNLYQRIEDYTALQNKKVTFSITFANNTDRFRLRINDTNGSSTSDYVTASSGTVSVTRSVGTGLSQLRCIIMLETTGTSMSVDILNAKLEVGEIATPFSPRPYAEELALCQRYYQKYTFTTNMPLPLGIVRNSTTISLNFPIPKLRTYPTFATSGTVKLLNESVTGLSLVSNQYYDGWYRMFILSNSLTVGTGILVAGDTDGYYSFDAEIY